MQLENEFFCFRQVFIVKNLKKNFLYKNKNVKTTFSPIFSRCNMDDFLVRNNVLLVFHYCAYKINMDDDEKKKKKKLLGNKEKY